MSETLTKALSDTLRNISVDPRPCQCQFSDDALAWLGAYGLISIAACNVTGHGGITLTAEGRRALA